MHDNDPDPDLFQERHILGERFLELVIHHGRPAILDHEGLLLVLLDVRKGFNQDFGFVANRDHSILRCGSWR